MTPPPPAPPPRTTLGLILSGLPADEGDLARAVRRVEDCLDKLEAALRQQAAEKSKP